MPFQPGEECAQPAPRRGAPRDFRALGGRDAQDDGGRRPLRHGETGSTQWLFVRGQDGDRTKGRPAHPSLFKDHARSLVCRHRADQQSGDLGGGGDGHAQRSSYYGTAVSAPVFAEVAQQVLEYLGVPHDIDIRQPKAPAKPQKPTREDDQDNEPDINALFAAVNDLPPDDPLREPAPQPAPPPPVASEQPVSETAQNAAPDTPAPPMPPPPARQKTVIVTADGERKVPELVGLPVRKVIEAAAMAGLEVEITGSGTVREQAPAAGTVVGPNTRLVVRCSH